MTMAKTATATATKDPLVPHGDDLMNAILGQIYDKLTDGDGETVQPQDTFFAWATPGIPLSDDQFDFMAGLTGATEAETSRRWAMAADFATLVDFRPSVNGVFTSGDQQMVIANRRGTLSGEWERVLSMGQVADEPLSEEDQAQLDRFEGLLRVTRTEKDLISGEERTVTDDSPLVKLYNEKLAAFELAALEFNNARIDALNNVEGSAARFAVNGPILRRRVSAARDDWLAAGHKNEVEQIRAWIAQVTGRSMVSYVARLRERFEQAKAASAQSGLDFLYTAVSPAGILGAPSWSTFTFDTSQSRVASSSRTNKKGFGAGVGWGGFSLGGKGTSERTEVKASTDTSKFSLTFELAQVPISRGWFAPEFLESRGWRFAPGGQALSDGGEPPTGSLVAYPDRLVLARNIELNFAELHDTSSEVHKALSASGSVGYGPFKLSGEYGRTSQDKVVEHGEKGQGIVVKGAQIIGYGCSMFTEPVPNPAEDIPEEHWV
jgi:hypothetical protein